MRASDLARRTLGAAALALSVGGCGDPLLPREAPELRSMTLFLILDPDKPNQPLLVKPAETVGTLPGLTGEIRVDGRVAASVPPLAGEPDLGAYVPCQARYGPISVAQPRCLDFALRPEFGRTYQVAISANGHPAASASATVPGDFRITSARASGAPPGTGGLQVRWSASPGAFRYVVAVRPATAPRCVQIRDCDQGWSMATRDTSLDATVPAEALAGGEGPWYVDVYAMDQALYEYLTTGTTGNLFPVGAVQNVAGGYGAVGAWVVRSQKL